MVSGRLAQVASRLWAAAVAAVAGPSHGLRVCVLFFLTVPQIYLLPEGSRDVALTTIATIVITPVVFLRAGTRRFSRLFYLLVALLAVRVLALLWSPEPRAGAQSIVLLAQFIVTLVLIREALRQGNDLPRLLERVYWPWVAAEALLVVVFRLLPGVEHTFHDFLGGLFTGQNAITTLVPKGPNNVIDTAKAGGVFLNANVAAMFLGVNGLAALAMSSITGSRLVRRIGIAALLAVPFTGSKSATVLALALPAAAMLIFRMKHSPPRLLRRPVLLVSMGLATVTLIIVGGLVFGFLGTLGEAFIGRTAIWGFGASAFVEHPLLGLGYGGWEAGFATYAAEQGIYRDDFPPHNLLLSVWSKTGLLGLGVTVAFFVVLTGQVMRALSQRSSLDTKFAAFSAMALGWVLIQGLGENTDIFGEIHLLPMVALLITYLGQHAGEGNRYHGRHTRRRGHQAPTVPPVGDVHRQPGPRDAAIPSPVRWPGSDPGDARG